MEIKLLNKEEYKGKKFTVRYKTNGYYDIEKIDTGFDIKYIKFDSCIEKTFDDEFFGEWLNDPIVYGAFESGKLVGFVEDAIEDWNNRYRISNICIFDELSRNKGIGTLLMNTILKQAKLTGARIAILETQTCNEKAISFYKNMGFEVIGFDLYSYSNYDLENHEVRIEMGKKLI